MRAKGLIGAGISKDFAEADDVLPEQKQED
jgi:hypothetical protein